MIEQSMFVMWSPPRAGDVIDFDLPHLLDAVDGARHADLLLFRRRRWARLCLWLLWHDYLQILLSAGSFCCCQRSFKHSRISSATTEISLARFTNLVERGVWILFQVGGNRGYEAGRAKAAHQTIVLYKRSLYRTHLVRRAESFDRRQLLTNGINCQHQTRINILAVHQHCASPARAHVANKLWSGHCRVQLITQRVQQRGARFDTDVPLCAVHVKHNIDGAVYRLPGAKGLFGRDVCS